MLHKDFAWAVEKLKCGEKVTRPGWEGMWIELHSENATIYIASPVGHRAYPQGSTSPWMATSVDILATDWQEVGVEVL